MGGGGGPCGMCEAAAHLSCGGCGVVHYCGKEHQRQHWPQHRQHCQSYKVVESAEGGRFLVSSRQMVAGHILLEDVPLVVGPMAVSPGVCLGCHEKIEGPEVPRCPGCWWPLCSPECATARNHLPECAVLAKDTKRIAAPKSLETTQRYEVILTLRCLLLREQAPGAWKELLTMAHHQEQRMANVEPDMLATQKYLIEVLQLDFSLELVNQVMGAIATNSLEIRTPEHNTVRSLYSKVRLLNNSCVPNVHLCSVPNGLMQMRTAVGVEAGEMLTICYTGTLLPLWERQHIFANNYFFTCNCVRCTDPTEMGTHFSSPRCPECTGTFLEPAPWLGTTTWVCPTCHLEEKEAKIRADVTEWLTRLQMDDILGSLGNPYKRVMALLVQVEDEFHPTHFLWLKVAQASLYRLRDDDSLRTLKLRRRLWQKLIDLFSKLEPGSTRRRGMSQLELGALMLKEAKTEYAGGDAFLPAFVQNLRSLVTLLEDTSTILDLDHPGSVGKALVAIVETKKAEAEEFLKSLNYEGPRSE